MAPSGGGQHGDDRFRNVGQEACHTITDAYAGRPEGLCRARHFGVQFRVARRPGFATFISKTMACRSSL